jgi:hypothetical protein
VLQDNGGDDLTLGNVGTFTFATKLASGAAYAVTVKSSPSLPRQDCVTGANAGGPATGTVAGADVTSLFVFCSPVPVKLGGTVSGLVGSGLVLAAELQTLPVAANGSFEFTAPVLSTGNYSVTVATQPSSPAQTCVVTNGSGSQPTADVDDRAGHLLRARLRLRHRERHRGHARQRHRRQRDLGRRRHGAPDPEQHRDQRTGDGDDPEVRDRRARRQRRHRRARRRFGAATATLVAAGDDVSNGFITFRSSVAPGSSHHWRSLRGLNANSRIDLRYTLLGDAAPDAATAAIQVQGGGTLPDPLLKVDTVQIQNLAGPGVYLSNAAFTADSRILQVWGAPGYPIELSAMALGSVPTGASLISNQHDEILVVDNANIFDNLTISTPLPIRFNTAGVHVGGLARASCRT